MRTRAALVAGAIVLTVGGGAVGTTLVSGGGNAVVADPAAAPVPEATSSATPSSPASAGSPSSSTTPTATDSTQPATTTDSLVIAGTTSAPTKTSKPKPTRKPKPSSTPTPTYTPTPTPSDGHACPANQSWDPDPGYGNAAQCVWTSAPVGYDLHPATPNNGLPYLTPSYAEGNCLNGLTAHIPYHGDGMSTGGQAGEKKCVNHHWVVTKAPVDATPPPATPKSTDSTPGD
jgi:hypothetical protein